VVGWGWPSSLRELDRWHAASQGNQTHRWVVLDGKSNIVGVTGLWDVDWHNRNALTAVKLGGVPNARGRGLGTDAIKLLMAYAFYDVGLERLYSSILAHNAASLTAYVDNCGWSVEGTSRRHVWRHGKFVDLLQIGVLRDEFDALPDADEYRSRVLAAAAEHA
jgi:RimJ/RimL family protein N-acetyltransferase